MQTQLKFAHLPRGVHAYHHLFATLGEDVQDHLRRLLVLLGGDRAYAVSQNADQLGGYRATCLGRYRNRFKRKVQRPAQMETAGRQDQHARRKQQ